MEGTLHKGDEDHIAGRGINPLSDYNLVHKNGKNLIRYQHGN